MAIKLMGDNNIDIFAKEDANHYYALSGYDKSYVVEVDNLLEATFDGLLVTIGKGQASCYGRHVVVDEPTVITLPQSEVGYIVLSIDLTRPVGFEAQLMVKSILEQQDLSSDGLVYDIPLYSFVSSINSVTNSDDLRTYRVANSKVIFYTAILTTNWLGATAPFTQTVMVNGISANDIPIVDIVLSDDVNIAIDEERGWGNVSKIKTFNGYIVAQCNRNKPTVPLTIQIRKDGSVREEEIVEEVGEITVATHNSTPNSHPTLRVDGSVLDVFDGTITSDLQSHATDEYAHQNIIIDGNIIEKGD